MTSPSPSPSRENTEADNPASRSSLALAVRDAVITTVVAGIGGSLWPGVNTVVASLPGGWLVPALAIGLALTLLLRQPRIAPLWQKVAGPLTSAGDLVRDLLPTGGRTERARSRLRRALPLVAIGYVAVVAGAVAGLLLPWAGGRAVAWLGPCDPARELQVITAPENTHALRTAVARFLREREGGRCPEHRISVGPAPSMEEMIDGFQRDWRRGDVRGDNEPFVRLLGPRPAAWIPSSTGEAEYVRNRVNTAEVTLTRGLSVDRDRLVVGMLGTVADGVAVELGEPQPGGYPLGDLVEVARGTRELLLSYPQPGLSSAGLIALSEFAGLDMSADTAASIAFDDDVSAMLCRLKDPATPDREKIAMVVPSHSLHDYNSRSLVDEGCPGAVPYGGQALHEFASPDLSALDYPFVTVDWRAEPRPAADRRVLGDLMRWLAANGLFHSPVPQGQAQVSDDAALHRARERLDNVLPEVTLTLMLDGSESMSVPPSVLALKTREALPFMRRTLIPDDRVALGAFSVAGGGLRVTEPGGQAGRDELHRLTLSFDRLPHGSDARVSDMLGRLSPAIDPPGASVAVLTDGGLFNDETADDAIAKALGSAGRVHGLYILVLGDGSCGNRFPPGGPQARGPKAGGAEAGGPQAAGAQAGGKPIVCAEAGQDVESALTRMVATIRGWTR
ncbi:hypothetical protein Misp01_26670 [Microtetraspora sp. NBRC 13810]|uniref:hypothetical protein n=1 Tax=Microtetraspora sp. NBRC 13810 TaxID=3030990 RepID=UPI0024A460ED|nr:hypothetical protein [Microtetraspora sp. NBRC 13810]GLW07537.1 hypothetical protein Misp01_26670 [Microtetraspora sp. NBRC 13810]